MIKKIYLTLVVLALLDATGLAQEPVITMVVAAKGKPFSVDLRGASGSAIAVDFGDGDVVAQTLRGDGATISLASKANLAGENATVKISGADITYLNVAGRSLKSLDVGNCATIQELRCDNNSIEVLDVSRNAALQQLSCDGNKLEELSIAGNAKLFYLSCKSNKLKSLDLTGNSALRVLFCDDNRLEAIDIRNAVALEDFFCGGNRLTTLDVSNNIALRSLDCSHNRLQTLDLSSNAKLETVTVNHNWFTLTSLFQMKSQWAYRWYAPQRKLKLPLVSCVTGEVVDLSAQLMAKDASGAVQKTRYQWYTTKGHLLTLGKHYTESDGIFVFKEAIPDSVYCRMSNRAYPDFDKGMDSWFKTEPIKVYGTTGISEGTADAVKAYVSNDSVIVEGLRGGEAISVVNMLGSVVHQSVAGGSSVTIPLPVHGLYVVKVGTSAHKVAW